MERAADRAICITLVVGDLLTRGSSTSPSRRRRGGLANDVGVVVRERPLKLVPDEASKHCENSGIVVRRFALAQPTQRDG